MIHQDFSAGQAENGMTLTGWMMESLLMAEFYGLW